MGRKKIRITPESAERIKRTLLELLPTSAAGAVTGKDLLKKTKEQLAWPDLPEPRFWGIVSELRELGLVQARRKRGYWRVSAEEDATDEDILEAVTKDIEEEVPKVASKKEKDYYEYIRRWMERAFRCHGEVVSEKGKRGKRSVSRLAAVPDVVGKRYITGPTQDEVELLAVEVKLGKPKSGDLSEAYRYSRFADYCYLAYDEDGLSDDALRREVLSECGHMGLGVMKYPNSRRQGKATQELLSAGRQTPSTIAKESYLAKILDLYRCIYCGTFHDGDHGRFFDHDRSDIYATRELTAKRFVCRSCVVDLCPGPVTGKR